MAAAPHLGRESRVLLGRRQSHDGPSNKGEYGVEGLHSRNVQGRGNTWEDRLKRRERLRFLNSQVQRGALA